MTTRRREAARLLCAMLSAVTALASCSPGSVGGAPTDVPPPPITPEPCAPETDTAFCARLGKGCGEVRGADNCGTARTVASCGSCSGGDTCGGGGTANTCGRTVITPPACLADEICGNGQDDDCDGQADESGCLPVDAYLADWTRLGEVVDWVVFGTYPLYADTQLGRDLQRQSWGSRCAGQSGPTPVEESMYCIGGDADYIEWSMTVPADGDYVLMLASIQAAAASGLSVDRGGGLEALPPIDGSRTVRLLDYGVGAPPESLFYLVHLPAGTSRFHVDGTTRVELTTAVLGFVKAREHSYPSPTYPHVNFTSAQIAALQAGPLSAGQQAIIDEIGRDAEANLGVADLASMGRDRQGVLEALSYSGVLRGDAAHLAKAMDLLRGHVSWIAARGGSFDDILMYGYDLRQLGTCWDLLQPHLASTLSAGAFATVREQLSVEMMRHALTNVGGNWWRLPRQGGWTISMAQGAELALALVGDDPLARFYLDTSLLMAKTALRDNLSPDGSYLQALGSYYGWDLTRVTYLLNGLDNNPGVSGEDLWAYGDGALRRYFHWLVYSLAPTRRCMGPFGSESCANLFYESFVSSLLGVARHYHDGVVRWMHDELTLEGHPAYLVPSAMPEAIAWYDGLPAAVDPESVLPLGKVTRGNEFVFLRTGWDEADTAFMSHCGLTGNHSQREQGSFILYADGFNYVQAYNNYPADTQQLTGSTDKNFVIIDGKGQAFVDAMDARLGSVASFLHSGAVDFSDCDNAAAYGADPTDVTSQPVDYSNRRVLFVRPTPATGGYLVMLDRIAATGGGAHRYELQYHAGCRIQGGESDGQCTDPVTVATPGAPYYRLVAPGGGGQRLTIALAEPDAANQTSTVTPMPVAGFPDVLRVRSAADRDVGEFAAVLFPEDPATGRTLPTFTRLAPGAGQVGFTLGADTLLWSKDGSPLSWSGMVSDARVVLVRDDGGLRLAALFEGTTLSVAGVALLTLSGQANGVVEVRGADRIVTAGSDMASGAALTVTVGGLQPARPYACTVAGASRGTVTASAGGVVTVGGVGPAATEVTLTAQ